MTPQEKLIRAREACAAVRSLHAKGYRRGDYDEGDNMKLALRALTDLDKPIPDADEAWRPFLEAIGWGTATPIDSIDRENIAGLKAAPPLIPEQYR